jgi:hypothetical protein
LSAGRSNLASKADIVVTIGRSHTVGCDVDHRFGECGGFSRCVARWRPRASGWKGWLVTATLGVIAAKAHRGYRHEALVYRGVDGFLDAVLPFVREGVALGQPVLVAVRPTHIQALQAALGSAADGVEFVDMSALGSNPARIIPAWQSFIARHAATGAAIRGVGEPIWAGRRPTELEECQFHEALLNLAVGPDTPLWLLCPYDAAALPAEVIAEAHRSHPAIVESDGYRGSTTYGGAFHVGAMFGRELAPPTGPVRNLVVSGGDGPQVADWVRRWAEASGLSARRSGRLAGAVRAVTQAGVDRAGRTEILQLWQDGSALICQLQDTDHLQDPMVGRRSLEQESPFGQALRLANDVCDLVQVRSGARGTTVRVHTWL